MNISELNNLANLLGLLIIIGGQFMLFRHQLHEMQKRLDEITKALDKEKEERKDLLIELYKSFVHKDTHVVEITRLETKIRELEAKL